MTDLRRFQCNTNFSFPAIALRRKDEIASRSKQWWWEKVTVGCRVIMKFMWNFNFNIFISTMELTNIFKNIKIIDHSSVCNSAFSLSHRSCVVRASIKMINLWELLLLLSLSALNECMPIPSPHRSSFRLTKILALPASSFLVFYFIKFLEEWQEEIDCEFLS